MATKPRAKDAFRDGIFSPTHPIFRPYVTALGQLALAWNRLHETLCSLYCTVMGAGIINQHLAVWHALKADRAQREILKAAAATNLFGVIPKKFNEDIIWILERADSLEEARNNAIHSPLFVNSHPITTPFRVQ